MMKSSHFFLCCLFTLALYFLSHHTCFSQTVIPRPRKLSMTIPVVQHEYHKIEVADEAMESYPPKEDSMTLEYTSNSKSPHDLVYHIDYHGVTTHPTPKHPKP